MEDPEKSGSQPPKTTYASVRRQRIIGLGSEASVVGFLWVGYILGGAGIGYFLDAHFHTSFLTPALLLFGAVEGFREMMVTVSRLNKNPKPGSANSGTVAGNGQSKAGHKEYAGVHEAPEPVASATSQRIFQVPAPPQSSFASGATDSAATLSRSATNRSDESEPQNSAANSSSEELIKKLLNEHPDSPQ